MKRILILKAASDICQDEICKIEASAKHFQMEPTVIDVISLDDLKRELNYLNFKYDYIYLCTHANENGFGDSDSKSLDVTWERFGNILCTTNCMNYNCILLLAGCRTGLNRVAFDMFFSCGKIEFICGPRWKLIPQDLSVAFDVFIYNIEVRREEPKTAAYRMSQAVGFEFEFYDRLVVETDQDYHMRSQKIINKQELNELENNKAMSIEVMQIGTEKDN